MNEVRSKIAQYIAGEVKLEQLIDGQRIRAPVEKRFMFDDHWITMNRKIGEAVIVGENVADAATGGAAAKVWKPSAIQARRRNAIAVTDPQRRLMSNGATWPERADWVVGADQRIRYAPMLQPLRPLNRVEWAFQQSVEPLPAATAATAAQVTAGGRQSPAIDIGSNVELPKRMFHTYGNITPASFNGSSYT